METVRNLRGMHRRLSFVCVLSGVLGVASRDNLVYSLTLVGKLIILARVLQLWPYLNATEQIALGGGKEDVHVRV